MAHKKAHEVSRFISKPDPAFPILLIYGPDRGLVSEHAANLAKRTGIALDDPFSTIRLDASEIDADPAKLGDEARTPSLFGGKRLIWLRGAGSQKQKGVIEAVKWLLEAPPEQVIVIIEAGNLDKKSELRKKVEAASHAMALPCYSDDARAINDLITQIVVDEFNLNISLEARKLLSENLGEDRVASRSELEKLCLYAVDQGRISVEDVSVCVSNVSVNSQDLIVDALISGDLPHFNEQFDRYCTTAQPLFLVISAAQRQFQQLRQWRDIMESSNKNASVVVAEVKPPIFFKKKPAITAALSRWTTADLDRAYARLQDCLLESRRYHTLEAPIIRQHLLALTVEAKRLG